MQTSPAIAALLDPFAALQAGAMGVGAASGSGAPTDGTTDKSDESAVDGGLFGDALAAAMAAALGVAPAGQPTQGVATPVEGQGGEFTGAKGVQTPPLAFAPGLIGTQAALAADTAGQDASASPADIETMAMAQPVKLAAAGAPQVSTAIQPNTVANAGPTVLQPDTASLASVSNATSTTEGPARASSQIATAEPSVKAGAATTPTAALSQPPVASPPAANPTASAAPAATAAAVAAAVPAAVAAPDTNAAPAVPNASTEAATTAAYLPAAQGAAAAAAAAAKATSGTSEAGGRNTKTKAATGSDEARGAPAVAKTEANAAPQAVIADKTEDELALPAADDQSGSAEPDLDRPALAAASHSAAEFRSVHASGAETPRATPHTVALLAAQIASKVDGKSTRFDVQLDPHGLGKVNVRVEISARGDVTAALSFESPEAASELRGRAGELQTALEQAGFDLTKTSLSFNSGGQGQHQGLFDQQQQNQAPVWRGRAFADLSDTPEAALAPVQRRAAAGGVDVRI